MRVTDESKRCNRCDEAKPLKRFPSRKDRSNTICKDCTNRQANLRRQRKREAARPLEKSKKKTPKVSPGKPDNMSKSEYEMRLRAYDGIEGLL